jgi:hypothetical protein
VEFAYLPAKGFRNRLAGGDVPIQLSRQDHRLTITTVCITILCSSLSAQHLMTDYLRADADFV